MLFKLGFSVSDLPVFSRLEDYFKLANELQVDGIEVVLGYKTYLFSDYLKKLSKKYQVTIQSIHQPVMVVFKSPYAELPFQVAQYFQAKYVAHPLADVSLNDPKSKQYFLWLQEMQKKYLIQVLVENLPHEYILLGSSEHVISDNTVSNLSNLSEVCKQYGLGFTLDTSHLACTDPQNYPEFDKIQPYIQNIHLSDYHGIKTHLPLGTGDLNYKSFLNYLLESKYSGILNLEVFGDLGIDWVIRKSKIYQNIRYSVDLIKKYF